MADRNEIENALTYIDSTDRDTWLKVGTALKTELGASGFDLFDSWSQKAKNYNARAVVDVWKSAIVGTSNVGFIFNQAKERGFTRQNAKPMSAAEIAERNRRNEKLAKQAAIQKQKEQENATRKALFVWNQSTKANPNHPYLKAKGINDPIVLSSIRQQGGSLVIPLKQGKNIVGIQRIFENGNKFLPPNTPKRGSALIVGDTSQIAKGFYMAEGFATAATIAVATNRACVVCIDAGNLPEIAKKLKPFVDKHNTPVLVCADIDADHKGEKKANEAAEVLGKTAKVITPDFTANELQQWQDKHNGELPTDFNDLQAIGGIARVKSALKDAFRQTKPQDKLLINIYGSPATGKSYTAENLAAQFREIGVECALVTEYATELIKAGRHEELKDQITVTGEQLRREQEAFNHANIVITDSPTALGTLYSPTEQKDKVIQFGEQSDKIPHINILLRHNAESLATFSMNGRIHGKEESLRIQGEIIDMLQGKDRIHFERGIAIEELINHIGTNQEWQRFAKHHNINLPRFDIDMDSTVMNKDNNLSDSMKNVENDTLTLKKTAESITMTTAAKVIPTENKPSLLKPIHAKNYDDDPIRKAIQDIVIDDVTANFALYQQEYRQHPESFGGRYICSDLFKETMPFYNADRETRSLFNGLVHNSAAVLADKQFYDALREIRQENDSKGKVAVFLTGSPGAGKTSSIQQVMAGNANTALIYEGQLIRPESAVDKIQAALDSGLKVKILAVHNTPETVLDNTIRRFEKIGRGSSIEVMAQIMGKTADGLDQLHQHFGDRIELEIHERHENQRLPIQRGWEHLDILRKDGDYVQLKHRLGQVLEQSRETGTYSEDALHQAYGRTGRVEQRHRLSLSSALLAYETRPRVLGDSRKQSLLSALETLTPSKQNSDISQDDEKTRPPQGGFVLPETSFRQHEINQPKDNIMAKQDQLTVSPPLEKQELKPDTWQPETPEFTNPELENSIDFSDDRQMVVDEIERPTQPEMTNQEKVQAAFETLQNQYNGYRYNPETNEVAIENSKTQEKLHYDNDKIVYTAVDNGERKTIGDIDISDLSPEYIALSVENRRLTYNQELLQNGFPNEEKRQEFDRQADKLDESVREANRKTKTLIPPEAPPAELSERYLAVKRQFMDNTTHYGEKTNLGVKTRVDYVDAKNSKTVLFTDKGSKLTTAKNDPQTVADMIEVAKAKGWTTLKLSGNKEFKRQAWLAAESQGIKTRGYSPSPEDKVMLEKLREQKSLNTVEQGRQKQEQSPEKADNQPQKVVKNKQTANKGGILLAHGQAPYEFNDKNMDSYYAKVQFADGKEKVFWGVGLQDAIANSGAKIGDRISLNSTGKETVRVRADKDTDGKAFVSNDTNVEEKTFERNAWHVTIHEKAQTKEELVQEQLVADAVATGVVSTRNYEIDKSIESEKEMLNQSMQTLPERNGNYTDTMMLQIRQDYEKAISTLPKHQQQDLNRLENYVIKELGNHPQISKDALNQTMSAFKRQVTEDINNGTFNMPSYDKQVTRTQSKTRSVIKEKGLSIG